MSAVVDQSDAELLQEYLQSADREVLGRLISRHVDFVYSTARRQVHDVHLAEDVTQAVFIILSQKARKVRPDRLMGWLFQTTRYAAANALKSQRRRAHYERQAAAPEVHMPDPSAAINDI